MHVEIRELGPEDAQAVGEAAFLLDSEPDAEATRLFLTDLGTTCSSPTTAAVGRSASSPAWS